MTPAQDPRLVRELADVVGADHVLVDDDVTAGYRTDWTGRFTSPSSVVARPGETAEVAAVVDLCRASGVALVAQGGNTGLVGGGIPTQGEVVLSLRRLAGAHEVDGASGQVVVGAGTTIGAVHALAAEAGWAYGVDLASRDSATVGGTIATNAGGLRVLRYGDTRAQVMGVETVLGDGHTVTALTGLYRNNTGYHLPSLLCGSEGTLGVVTAARLRLVPRLRHRVTALLAFDTIDAALAAAALLRRAVVGLEAVELFLQAGLELVCSAGSLPRPFPDPHVAYLLVETAGQIEDRGELAAALESVPGIADAAVATDPARGRALWRYRETHTEAIGTVGTPHKLDLALPLPQLAPFLDRLPSLLAELAAGAQAWVFGHVADGNLHVNVTGVAPDDESIDDAVFRLVAELGGSVSAEHGIGTAKRRWVGLSRTEAELDPFRAIKRALDPAGILNPHALLPPATP
jgi:FAD/FMN-containing dehydrogenase